MHFRVLTVKEGSQALLGGRDSKAMQDCVSAALWTLPLGLRVRRAHRAAPG